MFTGFRVVFKAGFRSPARENEPWLDALLPEDRRSVANLNETREKVLADLKEQDATANKAIIELLTAPIKPIRIKDIVGSWRCRFLDAASPSFFPCQIEQKDGKIILDKKGGSQQYTGVLDIIDDQRLLFRGAYHIKGDPPGTYGEGNIFEDDYVKLLFNEVGILQQISKDRLRLEFAGEDSERILELIRDK